MATRNSAVFKRNGATGTFHVDLPPDVGEKAGLKEGDRLVVTTTQDGRIIIRPKSARCATFGEWFDLGCARLPGGELLRQVTRPE